MTTTEEVLDKIEDLEALASQTSPYGWPDLIPHTKDDVVRWYAQPHSKECGYREMEGLQEGCTCGYPQRLLEACGILRGLVTDGALPYDVLEALAALLGRMEPT